MGSDRVRVLSPAQLSDDLLAIWRSHQAANEDLRGPFFSPEYVLAASVRPEVSVAVLEAPGQLPAFLPFHRDRANVARPVGLRANDFSGVIAARGREWSPAEVVRECGLAGWDFANVAASQPAMQPYIRAVVEAPYIDLRKGFDGFAAERSGARSELLKSVARKTRKLEREVGAVRFDVQSHDARALELLFEWKAAQRARTGTVNVLAEPWMRQMLDRIWHTTTPAFGGLLSVVYAGNHVAAVSLCMRSDTVWHYWFAAFNRDLQQYSPGLILLLEMVRVAPLVGLDTLTLGKGDEPYKLRFASGATTIAAGSVDCCMRRRLVNFLWYAARDASHRSAVVAALARAVKRTSRAFEGVAQ